MCLQLTHQNAYVSPKPFFDAERDGISTDLTMCVSETASICCQSDNYVKLTLWLKEKW